MHAAGRKPKFRFYWRCWSDRDRDTWNTVRQDCGKVSKWDLDPELSANFPPKICIPNNEKMKMKRKRITSRELMDEMELTNDLTKLPIEAQYLKWIIFLGSQNKFFFPLIGHPEFRIGMFMFIVLCTSFDFGFNSIRHSMRKFSV